MGGKRSHTSDFTSGPCWTRTRPREQFSKKKLEPLTRRRDAAPRRLDRETGEMGLTANREEIEHSAPRCRCET